MKNTKRKGFTIVELVIVIAVIAILAAVLIPTFASLVKKANVSADEQAVKQMNTALAIYTAENGKPETVAQVKTALDKNLINAESMIPVTQGYAFYWNPTKNEIVLVGEDKATAESTWKLLTSTGYGTLKEASNESDITTAIINSSEANPALIKLTSDVTISDAMLNVTSGKAVIFDLNGKKLTLNKSGDIVKYTNTEKTETTNAVMFVENGSVTLKNGSVDLSKSNRGIANYGGSLVLNNVTITGDDADTGVYVEGISDTVIINTNITVKGYAVGTNSSSNKSDGARVSISGGKMVSKDDNATVKDSSNDYAAIFISIYADVTIDGCEIKGRGWGAYFRGCNATIKNSKISYDSGYSNGTKYNSGVTGHYCDIMFACGGKDNSGYITAGNYTCDNVTANSVVAHNPDGNGTVNVSGISYKTCTAAFGTTCNTAH